MLSYSPCQVKGLDLNAVAGSITIRSCPHAKNVTVLVREAAHSALGLQEMAVQSILQDGILQVAAMGPSFDWNHCQLSHITVIIPKSAFLTVEAHVVSGHIDAHAVQFKNLKLTTSVGYIRTHDVKISNELEIQLFAGYAHVHTTTSNITNLEIENGMIDVHTSWFLKETSIAVGFGFIRTRHLLSPQSLALTVGIGGICSEIGSESQLIDAHVDYGFLRIKPSDSSFYFTMKSNWGIVDVINHEEKPKFILQEKYEKNGIFGSVQNSNKRMVRITTTYARAQLILHNSAQLYE